MENIKYTVPVLFQWLQMHAELNCLRHIRIINKFAHNFDYLQLHRSLPVKSFVVAHENVR